MVILAAPAALDMFSSSALSIVSVTCDQQDEWEQQGLFLETTLIFHYGILLLLFFFISSFYCQSSTVPDNSLTFITGIM